jgi:hypothetical protein
MRSTTWSDRTRAGDPREQLEQPALERRDLVRREPARVEAVELRHQEVLEITVDALPLAHAVSLGLP